MSELTIKQGALKLFAAKGYEGTTIKEIGRAAGIKGSSIYSHFESKQEIFLEVVNDLFKELTWERIDPSEIISNIELFDLKAILYNVFKSYYHFFAEHKIELSFWQRLRFSPPAGLEGTYDINRLLYNKPIIEVYIELFSKGIELKQLKEGRAELFVMTFFVLISGYTDSLMIVPFKLPDEDLEAAFDIFWDGIKYSNI